MVNINFAVVMSLGIILLYFHTKKEIPFFMWYSMLSMVLPTAIGVLQENERTDLLDQYRALSAEAEQYQTSTHQLESEGSNLRLELMTKDSELRRARDKLDNLEREIQEVGLFLRWSIVKVHASLIHMFSIHYSGSTLVNFIIGWI